MGFYKNIQDLIEDNPEAVASHPEYGMGDYLERPICGWTGDDEKFLGWGYHGNESGEFKHNWLSCEKSGHMPSGGYG